MDWLIWLVILIPIIVSVVSLLLRQNQQQARLRNQVQPNPPQDQGGDRPTRRSVSDIDRFLEEINRRRREASNRKRGGDPVSTPLKPSQAPPPPARPIPTYDEKPQKRQDRERAVPARGREPNPFVQPILVAEALPAVAVIPPITPVPADPSKFIASEVIKTQKRVSAAMAQVLPLLRTPQGLKTAVILHEIFQGAKFRRRWRPGVR